jgi:ferric-dicitrate binding protein FerR (iron transport regulator)
MSARTPDDLEDWLNALADGLLSEEDEARLTDRLRGDAAAREHYRRFMALHAALMWDYAAVAAESPGQEEAKAPEVARVRWWRNAWALAAAVAVLVAVTALWLPKRGAEPRVIAELVASTGAVSWSDDSGTQRSGLATGARLAEGTLLIESEAGSAQLRFNDGTRLMLTGEAELAFSDAGQKRLNLRRGTFTAEVSKQPSGHPLLIRTATAELEVVGTSFSLAADPRQTALNVETGNVRMRRLADGRSVEVSAQQTAVAFLDAKADLRLARPDAPPPVWRQGFETPPVETSRGKWFGAEGSLAGRMRAVPYVAARGRDGVPIIHYGVSARSTPNEPAGLVTVNAGTIFHARYRLARPTTVKLFLSCRRGGTFAGNFEGPLPKPVSPPDNHGWITAELPLSALRPIMPEFPEIGDTQVSLVLLNSIETDASLEVAELAIRPAP